MDELSPAQVVLREFWDAPVSPARNAQIAAALRAAADQVVPEQKPWNRTSHASAAKHQARCDLLAIAAELDNNSTHQ